MKSELQAVILAAGKGSRMTELTNKIPKCLLPIANKPMIHFPLTMLIEADFTDVLIVVPDVHESEIKSQLSGYPIHMEFVTVPFKQDLGTADSLKLIHKRITSDVLILSCDFISNYPLRNFINFYRINDPSLSILIANESSVPSQGLVPGRKGKFKADKDIIGIDSQCPDRIVFLNSEVDFEEFINFKLSMIKLCPNIELHTNYFDGHVYILRKYLIDYLVNEKFNISSFKGEFVPSVIGSQFKRVLSTDQYNPYEIEDVSKSFQAKSRQDAGDAPKKSAYSYVRVDRLQKELDRFDPLNEHPEKPREPASYPHSLLNCSSVVVDSGEYFITRSNNILAYFEINKRARALLPDEKSATFDSDGQRSNRVSPDCIIGENTKLMGKTTVNRSIVGSNCTIHPKVTLENCLLMDNVVIEEGCVIKDSIICHNVRVAKQCKLSYCVVASNERVKEASILANESLVDTDQMMEFE